MSMSTTQDNLSLGSRIDFLSHPKKDIMTLRDRPSVYWVDRVNSASSCDLSERQKELAKPKFVNEHYRENRPSPVWEVSSAALKASPSPHLEQLAQAKSGSPEWKEDRSAYSTVSEAAKKASATDRIIELSKPKIRAPQSTTNTPNNCQEEDNECSISVKTEKTGGPTTRTETLALPKTEHPQYLHDNPIQRQVPASALHTKATDRVCQLAKAKSRKAIFEGYDPYKVTTAAKQAEASTRIQELSMAPARRIRPKKI